ncbi:MAG: hypothetical protein AUJ92_10825 [Armatimonadetes bacterium CG2_30_59_28]|nr:glycoside hydrolase family 95 protein [Armatimonadota bacterium]OIO94123.1 MAG: hypothetical protein AUJ92_10825 [Armatimonadetes bacterium CG2_30_59_28]PIU66716.1 MAG: alpha-L-fucosidase [Armatimonadetes bacterium CG07_land_8_20_14_0_80_59_28]PIX42537.1 MAG: alpha-L-fucosidase [Armatimonadetes bacterium CG_4_8_14_3_um_filter_58_9]PIY42615.1 MAG: alpha-L-fucosidase [Armatimonadetes bacterium CG_4_10_14_3_um_filter_59_10]PJB67872.1 MAG: alpha-L-fucosidase [Armatimonadetes bacterium CG_4_9_14
MTDERGNSILWYRQPAEEWKEGLPIGNGRLAGMVLGGAAEERVALNHEWLWRAAHRNRDVETKHHHLPDIRRRFFEGNMLEAGNFANECIGGPGGVSGTKNNVDSYQPAGDLLLSFDLSQSGNYRRELNLATGIVTVACTADGHRLERQYLAHAEYPVLVAHVVSESPHSCCVTLSRIEDPDCSITPWNDGESFGFTGAFVEGAQFAVGGRIIGSTGEFLLPAPGSFAVGVRGATRWTLLLSIAVDAEGRSNPAGVCMDQLSAAPADADKLLRSHAEAHRKVYSRVTLDLGSGGSDPPTDERLCRLREGEPDESLLALYFNFGRYLLQASSLNASVPANLQGKWNEECKPPWDCDLHCDVNIQMNYWPAEVCNLSDALEPLFDWMESCLPHGRRAARELYGCDGIWLPIQTDPWGRATPESYGWDIWTGAAAWLAQHLWWRYEYGLDEAFLRTRAYPFIKEVAAFYETYLVSDAQGRLVTVPSQSPENRFVGGTSPVSLCIAATMDLELIHDCLTHAIRASEMLGVDEEKRQQWQSILEKIPRLQIGKHAQLQEWLEDYDETEPGHRHFSHLFALYPGDQITLEDTPALTDAARVSLERRLAAEGGHTGWSRAWTVCLWARLREGNESHKHLRALVTDFATDTLLDLHPPRIFQIEGNLGGTAGIAEMLLQSHNGILRILPALPDAWPDGRITGLRARGGFRIDIEWRKGRARRIDLHSLKGQECRLQFDGADKASINTQQGENPMVQRDASTLTWQTRCEVSYSVVMEGDT